MVFTYADESINGIEVNISSQDLSLNQYLSDLEKQTSLKFRRLDSRYIAIQRRAPEPLVAGIIRDKTTQEEIEGAVVYSGRDYSISDTRGYFSLTVDPVKDSVIVIRHAGYQHFYLRKDDWFNEILSCELVPKMQIIDEVVVNYITKGLDKLQDGSIQMNVRNLEVLPGLSEPDVLHTVQVLPGILSINETVADINTRGGTNDQSLVLWDGVKMYQTGHFFGLISAFNSHLIHSTRIIKNGTNASFDEGISGVVDMNQQDYLANDFEASAGLNMVSGDLILKSPVTKKLSLVFGARHSINNLILTPTYKSYYERAFEDTEVLLNSQEQEQKVDKFHDFSFYDLSGKLLYDLSENSKLRFSVLNISNRIDYEENALIQNASVSKQSYLGQSSLLSNLYFSHSWDQNNITRLSSYLSYYLLDGSNASINENLDHIQENEVTDWGVKLDNRNQIGQTISLLSGYQFKEIGIRNLDNIRNPGYFRDAKDVLRIHSGYVEAESKDLWEKLYLRAGLRADYYLKFNKFIFDPVIVLNYRLGDNFSFEVLAERKSQHTTQLIDYQTDFLGVEKRRWVLSNEQSVPLLKSRQISTGIQYNSNNFLVSLEGYLKKVSGIITPSQGFQNQFQSVYATGEYNTRGIELLMNKRFRQSNIWTNYTLANNDYNFEELTPSVFPNNFDVRHALSFGGTYGMKQFEVSSGFNFRTGKPYTKPAQQNLNENNEIVYEDPNNSRLDEYIRFDVSAKYHFNLNKAKGELGVSVWNILDRKNVINIYYRKNVNNEIEQVTQHALGITPNVNFRIRF